MIEQTNYDDEQELFTNDPYVEAYGEQYKSQIRRLRSMLTEEETGHGQFVVADVESSLGKSRKSDQILRMYLDDFGLRNFLVVKRFQKDVEQTESFISESYQMNAALGITGLNWSGEWANRKSKLKDYRVLIITHERYQMLCLDEELRSYFTEGRHTLIIDEKIDFPTYTFDRAFYDKVMKALPPELHVQCSQVCAPLFKEIRARQQDEGGNMRISRCSKFSCHPATVANFIALVDANMNQIPQKMQKHVKKFAITLEVLYASKRRLYNGGRISAINQQHKLWGLENNIILDANGSIDYSYQASPRVKIEGFPRIVKHDKSKISWVKCNTSADSIRKHKNDLFPVVSHDYVLFGADQTALVVVHKEFEKELALTLSQRLGMDVGVGDHYVDERIAVNHFHNLVGKNTYRDFEQCWIVGTSNVTMETYVLKWMQYSEQDIGKVSLDFEVDEVLRFKNPHFEAMRKSFLVGEIYQCLKRVQRTPIPNAEFVVFTKAEDVFRGVVDQMCDIEIGRLAELEFAKSSNQDEESTSGSSEADKLATYIRSLEPGRYRKQDVYEGAGVNGKNFYKMRKNVALAALEAAGMLVVENKHFVIVATDFN